MASLYAIEPADFSLKWKMTTWSSGSSPAISCDERIYIGGYDFLCAIGNSYSFQEFLVNSFTNLENITPSIAMDGNGDLVLQRDISVLKHEKKMTNNLITPAKKHLIRLLAAHNTIVVHQHYKRFKEVC